MRDRVRVEGQRSPALFWVLIVIGVLITVTSAVMLLIMTTAATGMGSWPTTTGRIETASVGSFHSWHYGGSDNYELHVEYSYTVAGHSYRSARISAGGRPAYKSFEEASADLARQYVPGRPVQVYYSPDDPQRSILQQDSYYPGPFIMLPIGPLIIGAAFWLRRRRARRASPPDGSWPEPSSD
jgi:Protein of unknown function (DUF3592)